MMIRLEFPLATLCFFPYLNDFFRIFSFLRLSLSDHEIKFSQFLSRPRIIIFHRGSNLMCNLIMNRRGARAKLLFFSPLKLVVSTIIQRVEIRYSSAAQLRAGEQTRKYFSDINLRSHFAASNYPFPLPTHII